MHIPAERLPKYFRGMSFPVSVLEEKGDRVAYTVSRGELAALCEGDLVSATGTFTRVRKVRLTRPVEKVSTLRMKMAVWPIAEDNRTVVGPANRKRHHAGRSSAYARVVPTEKAVRRAKLSQDFVGQTFTAENCPRLLRVQVDAAAV